jgi:mRNA interferase RelE/StbE
MYKAEISEDAADFIRRQTKKVQRQLHKKIKNLERNPHSQKSRKLQGTDNLYRIVSGFYRIVYTLEHKKLKILVLRIAHRKVVYRNLPQE